MLSLACLALTTDSLRGEMDVAGPVWVPPVVASAPVDAPLKAREFAPPPAGYTHLDRLGGNARLEGEAVEAWRDQIRDYFLRKHPLIAADPWGLEALVGALHALARDFRGTIQQHAFNEIVEAYNAYTFFAARIDRIEADTRFLDTLKRHYAGEILGNGLHRFRFEEVVSGWDLLTGEAVRVALVLPEDTPARFLAREWPAFAQLDNPSRVRVLAFLARFNPGLQFLGRITLDERNVPVVHLPGRTDIVHVWQGVRSRSSFSITAGDWFALPSEGRMRAVALGQDPGTRPVP